MHDRREEPLDREYRQGRDREPRCHADGGGRHQGHDCHARHQRGGPDTRFLQLEMSEVLYGEAEPLAKEAFRQLLLEEAKTRLRERFGNQIAGLAQLAVDELMQDVLASLEVEERIRQRNRDREARRERLANILKGGGDQPPNREGGGDFESGDAGGSSSAPR